MSKLEKLFLLVSTFLISYLGHEIKQDRTLNQIILNNKISNKNLFLLYFLVVYFGI